MLTSTRLAAFATLSMLAIFLLKGQNQTPPPTPQTQVSPAAAGRFQIVQGDFVVFSSSRIPERGVFRIDTSTGKTWQFATGVKSDGTLYQSWQQVSE